MQHNPLTAINQSLSQAVKILQEENKGKDISEEDKTFIQSAEFIIKNAKERQSFFQQMVAENTKNKIPEEKLKILDGIFHENVVWFDIASSSSNINLLLVAFEVFGGRTIEELIVSTDWIPATKISNVFPSSVSGALVEISDRTQTLQNTKQYNFRMQFSPRLMKELVELPLIT